MAIIRCPECGGNVSDTCDVCIHCGYSLKPKNNVNNVQEIIIKKEPENRTNWPRPKDVSWIDSLKGKKKTAVLIWTVLFAITLPLGLIGLSGLYGMYVFLCLSFISLSCLLVCALDIKIVVRKCDGYSVVVYKGVFKKSLYIEGEEQVGTMTNRYLYGTLPNNKQIWVYVSPIDGSVKIGFGTEGADHQLL